MISLMTRTEAISIFLRKRAHFDLSSLYTSDMECQINVAQDGGKRVDGSYEGRSWQGWTDQITTWKSFRVPYNANTEPTYDDPIIKFDLALHVEAIGMTGWDWKAKLSRWVAFDFDAITGHSDKHAKKLTEEELTKIRSELEKIDWVTIRHSTGGKGLHIYVFLDPVETKNHNEHAALARAILGKMSAIVGFDLFTKVDICGQNMWVWHRKMTIANKGLVLLKRGSNLTDIPTHWKDHLKVITGHRKRVLPRFISGTNDSVPEQKFDELSNKTTVIELDDDHKKLIKWLEELSTGSTWDIDHHMLITHTYWLDKAHKEFVLKGEFKTLAVGNDAPTDVNCFAFPMRKGGWVVRRYSLGVSEAEMWEQDSKGWTRCFYNTELDINQACRISGGLEDPSGGYIFSEAAIAADALRLIGASVPDIAPSMRTKSAHIKMHKSGRAILEIDGDKAAVAALEMKGFLHKKGKWIKLFPINEAAPITEIEGNEYDDLVRHLISPSGNDAGWVIRGESTKWRKEPVHHVGLAMQALGMKPQDIQVALGTSVIRGWTLVNRPFQPEYPGGRLWNESAAQLAFLPSQGDDLKYEHWDMILEHVGASLTPSLQNNAWALANGVLTGADYLKLWIASVFKEPTEPLPYLFLHGNQNSGKSILHEAIKILLKGGYASADIALLDPRGFNDELSGAVVAVVEEIDLSKDKNAANRIKHWVTAKDIMIHPKTKTPYHTPNTLHFIQCANAQEFCPVFPGDSRITVIYVQDLDPINMIPKKSLLPLLEAEAPDFIAALLRLDLPPSNDRLNVPVIATASKIDVQEINSTPVQSFLASCCHRADGEKIIYADLYDKFVKYLDPIEATSWTKNKFGKELPPHFPKGRDTENNSQTTIGNISYTPPPESGTGKKKLFAVPDRLGIIFLRIDTSPKLDKKRMSPPDPIPIESELIKVGINGEHKEHSE